MNEESNIELLPIVRSDEFLPRISPWTKIAGIILVAGFAIAIALASVVRYDITTKASAIVRPTGELRVVQSSLEGTVQSIEVQENQAVKHGDVIAYLNDTELQARKNQLQENIRRGEDELNQLNAQIASLDAQSLAESALRNRLTSSAQADLTRVQRELRDRQVTSEASVEEAQANLDLAREELERYRQLEDVGAIAALQISERENEVRAAEAQLRRAQASLDPSTAEITVAQERIQQEQARGQASLANLDREREALLQRQIQIQKQIGQDQSELEQTELALERSVIRASTDGVILSLNLRNQGQVIRPGEAIARIAPTNTPFVIVAHVNSQDIGNLEVGQRVQLKISAYPFPDYGILNGTVMEIPPDVTVPQSESDGEIAASSAARSLSSYYDVLVEPEQVYLVRNDQEYMLQAGMEADASIITKEETILTFILRRARLLVDL